MFVRVAKLAAAPLVVALLVTSSCAADAEVSQTLSTRPVVEVTLSVPVGTTPVVVAPTTSLKPSFTPSNPVSGNSTPSDGVSTASPTPQVIPIAEPNVTSAPEIDEDTKAAGRDFLDSLTEEFHFEMAEELQTLAWIARSWSPNISVSIALEMSNGSRHGFAPQERHSSASTVKPLWAAAALDVVGSEAVELIGYEALVVSNNPVSGQLIDLAGGVDAVNEWGNRAAKLRATHLEAWRFGDENRVASGFNPDTPIGNKTSTSDLAKFYARLYRGQLLDVPRTALLRQWLRDTPHSMATPKDLGGVLLDRLPDSVAAASLHKGGWLPPGCCAVELRQMFDAGVVVLPDSGWFSLAIVGTRGEYFDQTVRWVSLAACRIYALVARDLAIDCARSGDGVHDPEVWPIANSVSQQSSSESKPVIYLTFDDGPHPTYTSQILDLLEQYGVRATFFVIGRSAEAHPDLIQRMLDEGHAIGNHTWNHDNLTELTREQFDETIGRKEAVLGITGTHCLRPPYGAFNEVTREWASEFGLGVITWDYTPKDWEPQSPEEIASKILANARDGVNLLLHDGGGDRSATIRGLEIALEELSKRGFHYATLDCA